MSTRIFLKKLAFILNVTSKSENDTFIIAWTCPVYRNLSRHATWHQRSYQIAFVKAKKSKSTEQYDCKLFFRFDGTCNLMVELSNSTGRDFDTTIKFNASTGEEHCEWFVCGVCGTEVAFTDFSLLFQRPESCRWQFSPNGSNFVFLESHH